MPTLLDMRKAYETQVKNCKMAHDIDGMLESKANLREVNAILDAEIIDHADEIGRVKSVNEDGTINVALGGNKP